MCERVCGRTALSQLRQFLTECVVTGRVVGRRCSVQNVQLVLTELQLFANGWGGVRNSLQSSVPRLCVTMSGVDSRTCFANQRAASCCSQWCRRFCWSLSWGVLWRLLGWLWCLRPAVLRGQWRHFVWDTLPCMGRRTGLRGVWYCRLGCGLPPTSKLPCIGSQKLAVTNFSVTVAPKNSAFSLWYHSSTSWWRVVFQAFLLL